MSTALDRPPLQGVEYLRQLLGLETHRIYDLCRQGRIPHVRVGRLIRVDPLAIEEWIRRGGTSSEAA